MQRSLVRQRNELSESHAVDADELNAKLWQISPRRSRTPSDTPSTPVTAGAELTEEQIIEGVQRIAYRDYEKLKGLGGRASREINPDPGPCPASKSDMDKRYHVSDHWHRESGLIERELKRWLDFRWHQFRMRESSKMFNRYEEAVHKYRQEKGIDWTVELQLDRQTKLEEWREYYIYERRKRRALEKKLDREEKELELAKEKVMKAKRNGSVGVPFSVLSKRATEMVRYRENMTQAREEVEMAQKRLEVLRAEGSLSAATKNMLVEQAEEDLESVQKNLEAQKSDEMEQLRKEVQRDVAQSHLANCQGAVNYANIRLEQLDTLLKWIAGQFAEIATEYASSSWGSHHNRDLLEGWERYYVYMRERLQLEQDKDAEDLRSGWIREQTEAEEARDDLLFPQERVRPLKALLSWIEREFPEIASQHAPFIQDSQSHEGHWDEANPPYSKPLANELARKASPLGKSTRRKGRSARERSPLSQVQASKVSKPGHRRRRPFNKKLSTTRHGMSSPEGHANDVGQVEEQRPPKAAVRRSERISQRTQDSGPPSLGLIRPPKSSSRRRPEGTARRSARILDRTEKIRSLGFDSDVKHAPSSIAAGRKSTRRTIIHPNTAYSGTPQGISKRRLRKATSRRK